MSGIDIQAGADVGADEGGLLAQFGAKLSLGLDTMVEELRKANRLEQARLANIPNYVTLAQASVANPTDIIDFGEPQPGRQWNIRLLATVTSTLAANAAVVTWYIGQRVPFPTAGMLSPDWAVWQFSSVPGFKDFSSNNITVLPRQHLMAGITGGTGATYMLTARFADLPVYNPLTSVDV